jgi:hypothetical protein
MTTIITVDSTNLTGQNSDDLTLSFNTPIGLDPNYHYDVALISSHVWYSYANIAAEHNNSTFRYYNNVTYKTVTIADGVYDLPTIITMINDLMTANGDDPTKIVFDINYNTFKTSVTLSGGYKVDWAYGDIHIIFGFAAVEQSATAIGSDIVDITRGVNSLLIHCDLCQSYTNNSTSDVMYSITPSSPPGSIIAITPNNPVWLQMRQFSKISSIRVYITDNAGRRVNFRGEPTTFIIAIKPRKKILSNLILERLEKFLINSTK